MTSERVVVVGGGVVGAACAYYLRKSGFAVTVVDKAGFGAACSHANCGYVCPSHVLPLAAPGAVWGVLKTLFQPKSPVRLKPRIDFGLWGWLLQFARRSNERDMLAAAVGIKALLDSSRALYDELLAAECMQVDWQSRGLLFAFATEAACRHFAHTDDLLRDKFGVETHRFTGDELEEFEPALVSGLAGGWWFPRDAHLRPDRLMSEWRRVLSAMDVEIRERTPVEDFGNTGDRATAVRSGSEEIAADHIVVAAGAWTPNFASRLGVKIPIQPGKGYSLTMSRPNLCPQTPLIFEEQRVAVTPFADGYRLGSMMEFNGYDDRMDRDRLDILRAGARLYLREPLGDAITEEWWGWRPMTTDGNPFVGRTPGWKNVWLAAGHSMLGLSQAPATGKLLAELVAGRSPHLDPTPYAPGR